MTRPLPSMGKYQSLYVYLRDRFANRVVMTFGEIEGLLGTALPEAARHEPSWWSTADTAAPSEQSGSWTSANRRAEVNFVARRVVFERGEAVDVRPRNG